MKVTDRLKKKISAIISGVIYTVDAKPRLAFTDGSPLEKKLALINDGVENMVDLLERDDSQHLMQQALEKLEEWRPDCLEAEDIADYDEVIEKLKKYLK